MGRGGGRIGGGGFSRGGGRGFSSHRSSGSFRRSSSGESIHRGGGFGSSGSLFGTGSSRHSAPMGHNSVRPPRPILPRPHYRTPPIIIPIEQTTDRETRYSRVSNEDFESPINQTKNMRSSSKQSGWLPSWYKWLSVIMLSVVVVLMVAAGMARHNAANTVTREKLPESACISTNHWIDDEVDWLSDTITVENAMRYFYMKTGVQPYLLITDNIDGKGGKITDAEAEQALKAIYDRLYDDEGHMIFAFMEYADSEYITWIYTGRSADSVIDADAREIILHNADRFYTDSSLSDDEFFAKVFKKSADTIMQDSSGDAMAATIYTIISVIILVLMAGGLIVFKLREQRMKEREQIKQVLNTNIGSADIQDLEEKYTKTDTGKEE